MISAFKKRPPSSLLGLKLERNRVEGTVLRRSGSRLEAQRSFQAALSLDPLSNDPELVGREIRNHLTEAGIREKRCAVCLPLDWALTLQTKVPNLPEADVQSFLDIEAEKGFPYSPEDLSIAFSRCRTPGGEQYATIVAIPKNHLALLGRVLKSAQLKPLSFSLAVSALQTSQEGSAEGVMALLIGENNLELQISARDGILALRSLEGMAETDGSQKKVDADLVSREIKITLGQLPRALSDTVRKLRLFGRQEFTQPLLREIRPRAASMGLEVETAGGQQINGFEVPLPNDKSPSPALSIAARHMLGHPSDFEFLPPKVSAWPKALAHFSSRKLVSGGAVAGAVLLLIASVFFVQHWKLSSLQSKWRAMQPTVIELEGLQQQIRKFGPWFDESHRTLRILRKITEAFPEDGAVTAKTLEIRALSTVICTGVARDSEALVKVTDQLRATKEVSDWRIDQVRGAPLQFSIFFHWVEKGGHDN